MAFARYTKKEMAIIVLNFNSHEIETTIDMKNLRLLFKKDDNLSDIGVIMSNWQHPNDPLKYFLVEEIINYQKTY